MLHTPSTCLLHEAIVVMHTVSATVYCSLLLRKVHRRFIQRQEPAHHRCMVCVSSICTVSLMHNTAHDPRRCAEPGMHAVHLPLHFAFVVDLMISKLKLASCVGGLAH